MQLDEELLVLLDGVVVEDLDVDLLHALALRERQRSHGLLVVLARRRRAVLLIAENNIWIDALLSEGVSE